MIFDELMEDESFICRNCGEEVEERDHGLCEPCRQEIMAEYTNQDGDDIAQVDMFEESGYNVFNDWEPLP